MDGWMDGRMEGWKDGRMEDVLDTNGTERHLAQDRAATNSRNPLICDKLGGTA